MLIFVWFLLTIPSDRLVCSLWVNQIPTETALVQSCGTTAIGNFRLDVVYQGVVICSRPGSSLAFVVQDCALTSPLSNYRLNLIQPNHQTAICSVITPTNKQPSAEEIAVQCPQARSGQYVIKYAGTRKADTATLCKPPAPPIPSTIATSENYHLLAGKLIWYGLAKADCGPGFSGVDPRTFAATPCGMEGARAEMIRWQNGLDAHILAASRSWNVPPQLLKRIIATETQFWPWTGIHDERGLIQITDDGAHVVLHFYLPGYYQMTIKQQAQARAEWLKQLDCPSCTPKDAYDHAKSVMPLYAQSLAAYYCMYGSWDDALRVWNVKHEVMQ